MKFSIAHRLFLAVLLLAAAIAVIELALVRWKLFDTALPATASVEPPGLDALKDSIAIQYLRKGGWSFLPSDSSQRKAWLRNEWAHLQAGGAVSEVYSPASLEAYRIGLLDKDGHYLSGALANRMMIAFASIDTQRRPLLANGEVIGSLVIAKPQSPDEALAIAFLIDQQDNLLMAAAFAALLSALAAVLLAAHFRRPIRQLVGGAQALESGQLHARVKLQRSDELGALAAAFNGMAARLEDVERARQQWIADTSHELRTPLSVLRAQIEALQDGIRPLSADSLAAMQRQVRSLGQLVDDLYQLAGADVGGLQYQHTDVEVWQLVGEVFEAFQDKFQSASLVATRIAMPISPIVKGDADRLRQLFTNLLENSLRYTASGGRVEITADVRGRELRIAVADSAPGVSEDLLPRLGERFFRVESSRSRKFGGSGLGLALCRQIVAAHGGRLEFSNSSLGGLCATVILECELRP